MDKTVKLGDPNKVMSEKEALFSATILDNILKYINGNCDEMATLANTITNDTAKYLDTISRNIVKDKVTGEPSVEF